MGYFGTMSDRYQGSREDRYDRYRNRTWYRDARDEENEQDDWAFEERD